MNLSLAVKDMFDGNEMNIYTNENNDVFMTREQIGQALGYTNPKKAIENIRARNRSRLDRFSVTHKMRATDGMEFYIESGVAHEKSHSIQ